MFPLKMKTIKHAPNHHYCHQNVTTTWIPLTLSRHQSLYTISLCDSFYTSIICFPLVLVFYTTLFVVIDTYNASVKTNNIAPRKIEIDREK